MNTKVRIGLVGDYNESVPAHSAIPRALELAAAASWIEVEASWLPTESVHDVSSLRDYDGLWCVPGSPYRSMEGALRAIRFARESGRPFLGTCGGFQHTIIEYARNVLGWANADHAESAPDATLPVIVPLACSLVEATDKIWFRPGSRAAAAYSCLEAEERYRCRYGLNPAFQKELVSGALCISGEDASGEVRVIELNAHPFFVATLFQPERAALNDCLPPLVTAFVQAAAIVKYD